MKPHKHVVAYLEPPSPLISGRSSTGLRTAAQYTEFWTCVENMPGCRRRPSIQMQGSRQSFVKSCERRKIGRYSEGIKVEPTALATLVQIVPLQTVENEWVKFQPLILGNIFSAFGKILVRSEIRHRGRGFAPALDYLNQSSACAALLGFTCSLILPSLI